MEKQKISIQERMRMFNARTRKHLQTLGSKSISENGSVEFEIPRARLLAGAKVVIEGTITATHTSETSYASHEDGIFNLVKNIKMDYNNGFTPFNLTGKGLKAYQYTLFPNSKTLLDNVASGRGRAVQGLVSSSGGTANTFRIIADLPVAVNERDAVGLVLLQDPTIQAKVNLELGQASDVHDGTAGFTYALSSMTVEVITNTFSVPVDPDARPDISVLKLVQERTETMIAGENRYKLPTGYTYRKIGFINYDSSGDRLSDANITSNIELILQQSDSIIRVSVDELVANNSSLFGGYIEDGILWLDFSSQGIINLGGGRDYINAQELTEFELKFTSNSAGTTKVITEVLSVLR